MRQVCPTCGQDLPNLDDQLTPRELEVLMHWWLTGSVKDAAHIVGVGEQRAKNMLANARNRSRVRTNSQLLSAHLDEVRTLVQSQVSQNTRSAEVA